VKGIADTGFIVALPGGTIGITSGRRRRERNYGTAADLRGSARRVGFHLESSLYVLSLLQDEMLRIAFDCNRNVEQLTELAGRYQDRKPDLADLCLIRMSELYPRHTVITVDETDFCVYRRNKREVIPLLCPPMSR
jgi:hypothetical protein